MADGNKADDPKSSKGVSGSTIPPDLVSGDRLGSMESDSGGNPQQADRYMSIGSGGRGGGTSHGLHNLHGSGGGGDSSGGYPANGYANLHGTGGGGSSSSSSMGYPHGIGNGYGSGHGFVNGYYANPYYGETQPSGGGGSGAVYHRAPGNLSNYLYYDSYGGAGVLPQQAPMNNNPYAAVPPRFLSNGNGAISPPEHALITDRLASLTIVGEGYVGHRNTVAEFRNQRHQRNTVPADARSNPYWRMRSVEDVKGSVIGVARNLHGCQFLRRMLKERRENAVRDLFDEVSGDIVKLMGHAVAATFVDDMSRLWTDEQVASVVQALGASLPWEVMAAARNQSGSNVLQNLISRIEGRRQETRWFVRGLAGVGELNLLALIRDHAGSRVIQKCLETFSPEHNLFIVGVVMDNPYDVAVNRHGCHTMKGCIDNSMDARTRDYLVYKVCEQGLFLAQNQFGNYVVQHVMRAVPGVQPWAMEMLHAEFRGMYVNLSRQKASSNVVQTCLAFFPQALRYQIVWELLSEDKFHDLIEDPFANYVLQSAVATTKGPLLQLLADAVRPYRDIRRDSMHARNLIEMLFPSRRQHIFLNRG